MAATDAGGLKKCKLRGCTRRFRGRGTKEFCCTPHGERHRQGKSIARKRFTRFVKRFRRAMAEEIGWAAARVGCIFCGRRLTGKQRVTCSSEDCLRLYSSEHARERREQARRKATRLASGVRVNFRYRSG